MNPYSATLNTMIPACTAAVLRILTQSNDALRRSSFLEAYKYTVDGLAAIQNELDWCLNTDPVLPFMHEYFIQLHNAILQLPDVTPAARKGQVNLIVKTNEETVERIGTLIREQAKEQDPDASVDVLEREYRLRTAND